MAIKRDIIVLLLLYFSGACMNRETMIEGPKGNRPRILLGNFWTCSVIIFGFLGNYIFAVLEP